MNMNVQGVFLHLLGDALGSVAVLIAGIAIQVSAKHMLPRVYLKITWTRAIWCLFFYCCLSRVMCL